MNFTITLGWWLIPTIITVLTLVIPWLKNRKKRKYSGSGNLVAAGLCAYFGALEAIATFFCQLFIIALTWGAYFAILYFTK